MWNPLKMYHAHGLWSHEYPGKFNCYLPVLSNRTRSLGPNSGLPCRPHVPTAKNHTQISEEIFGDVSQSVHILRVGNIFGRSEHLTKLLCKQVVSRYWTVHSRMDKSVDQNWQVQLSKIFKKIHANTSSLLELST